LTGYLGSGKTTLVNHILSNKKGIKFAVIVNDIGEVNIDADLIQKGGIVGKKDESLVALQNGCICCTLKMDLIEQINDIVKMRNFDYIVIEASGICEPAPIAQTICTIPRMSEEYTKNGVAKLDCIVTVVDALRLQSEFSCGNELTSKKIDEDDIENLIIQQIEFCNIILLNKASEVTLEELNRIKKIISTLQPKADIIECDYANVELDKIINTNKFEFEKVATSAGWISEIEKDITEEQEKEAKQHEHHHNHHEEHHHEDEHHHHHDEEEDHDHHECDHSDNCHCGHHHHHHENGEAEEYGISTFVYYRRPAFDFQKFDRFIAKKWNKNIIRAKGVCYFKHNKDMSYLFRASRCSKETY
jgi:Putative GTPases (G3E family)